MFKENSGNDRLDFFNKMAELRGKVGHLIAQPIIDNAVIAAKTGKSDWECPYKGAQAELWLAAFYKTKENIEL